jgi:serine/threonine protein kinase
MMALGRYSLDRLIAAGSMAEVHLGTDSTLLRKVAIKLPHAHLWLDPHARERFLREGRSIAGLSHEHIVHLYDLGEVDGRLYLAMEYVDGPSLERWIEDLGPMPCLVAFGLLLQILKGLCAAHAKGLLHRDIKPANLLLTPQGTLKIADFGLSRLLGESALSTAEGFIGTPRYAAPEIAEGGTHSDKSDVFSTALVALEMLRGKPVITAEDPHIALMILRESRFEDSHAAAPTAAPGMHRVLEGMLKKSPQERWSAATALAQIEAYTLEHRLNLLPSRIASYLQADPAQRAALSTTEKVDLAALWRAEAQAAEKEGQIATARKYRIVADQMASTVPIQNAGPKQDDSSAAKTSEKILIAHSHTPRMKKPRSFAGAGILLFTVLALTFFFWMRQSGKTPDRDSHLRPLDASTPAANAVAKPADANQTQANQDTASEAPKLPQAQVQVRAKPQAKTQSLPASAKPSPQTKSTKTAPAVLRVMTKPGLAEVFVDGEPHGRTPTPWIALAPGEYLVRLVREGCRTLEERITLSPTDSLEMRRELVRDSEAPGNF